MVFLSGFGLIGFCFGEILKVWAFCLFVFVVVVSWGFVFVVLFFF